MGCGNQEGAFGAECLGLPEKRAMCSIANAVPLLAVAVSVAAACFAGAAWWTNREKLRLDLYNRRFDVYSRTLDFYHALLEWIPSGSEKALTSLQDSPELRQTLRAFIKASREARFLFGEDSGVRKRLEQMRDDTMGIIGYQRDLAPKLNSPPDMIAEYENFKERWNRIHESIPLLEKEMSKYLNFHALSAWGGSTKQRQE